MRTKILFFIVGVLMSVSCNSLLDVEPENSVTFTNYYKNENDLDGLMRGMHAMLVNAMSRFNPQEYAGVKADESPSGHNPVPDVYMRFHFWNSVGTSWKTFYDVIYQCNLLFDNVKSPVCSEDRMDFYFGQANFIKSFCYFQLARYWGDVIITDHTEDASPLPKSPMLEVLDTAMACAKRAYHLLPKHEDLVNVSGAKITSKQYGSKGNVAALIANINVWKATMGKNISEEKKRECLEEAELYATKIIDSDECGVYELESNITALVNNTLNNRGGKESIFEIELNTKDGTLESRAYTSAYWFVGFPIVPGKLPGDIQMNQWLIKNETVLDMYPGTDERRNEFFYKPDLYTNNEDSARVCGGYAFEYKFRKAIFGTSTTTEETLEFVNFDANKIFWRLADLILLRAEIRARLGNTGGAIADLQRVQRRANAPEYESGDLFMAIFREREKELIFEDHRFFDIVRNDGYYKTELPKNSVFVPFPFPHYEEEEVYSLLTQDDIDNGALYLPIGSGAFYLNSSMIQNTYWFNRK